MVRIKGANSDYKFDINTGKIEGPEPLDNPVFDEPVYLKIFICPYDMPSRVEAPVNDAEGNHWCEGTNDKCPHEGDSLGHAVVSLHQDEGIRLETNHGNQLVVDQKNGILLQPDSKTSIEVRSTHITLKRDNTSIEISKDGNITLSVPSKKQVKVDGTLTTTQNLTVGQSLTVGKNLTINGNLTVKGDVALTGKLDLSKATVTLPKTLIAQIVQQVSAQK